MIQGIKVENGAFAGGAFDWATPFARVCALGVALGMRCSARPGCDEDRRRRSRSARGAGQIVAARRAGLHGRRQPVDAADVPSIGQRWFSLPNISILWPVPVLTALTAYIGWLGSQRGRDALPFLSAIALFLLGYMGLVISVPLSRAAVAHGLGRRRRAGRARCSCWSAR